MGFFDNYPFTFFIEISAGRYQEQKLQGMNIDMIFFAKMHFLS